jgi:hypothetical protein
VFPRDRGGEKMQVSGSTFSLRLHVDFRHLVKSQTSTIKLHRGSSLPFVCLAGPNGTNVFSIRFTQRSYFLRRACG